MAGMVMTEQMEMKGSVRRIKSCAFDLIAIGNELIEENLDFENCDDEFVFWDLIERELRLKSTFLYCDFAKMISLVPTSEQKVKLTSLANRLFDSIEEVDYVVKEGRIEVTRERYANTLAVLHDVVALML